MRFNVRVQISVKPDQVDAFKAAIIELLGHTTKEPEEISARVFQDGKDPTAMIVYEAWEISGSDAASFQAQITGKPYFQAYLDKTRPMLQGKPETHFPATVLERGKIVAQTDGVLWASVANCVVVEENDSFEKAIPVFVDELAKLPEHRYLHVTHDLAEPSRWFCIEEWAASEEWYLALQEKQIVKSFLEVVKDSMVSEPVVMSDLKVVYAYDAMAI